MTARPNELELLALIEGELDAQAAGALRQRVAVDAGALGRLEELCGDRTALRSVPEPELPMDFLAAIEPMLARPMLMEPVDATASMKLAKPGEYRRQYRKRTRRIRWDRLAIAAIVMLALGAGLWTALNGWSSRPGANDHSVAVNAGSGVEDVANADNLVGAVDSNAESISLDTGTVHHYRPSPLPGRESAPLAHAAPAVTPDASGGSPLVAAQFALVIHAADAAAIEQMIQRASADLGERSALVRNFSFAEAQKLEEEWRVARAGSATSASDPRVASMGGGSEPQWRTPAEIKVLAERVQQRLGLKRGVNAAEPSANEPSGQLAGPKALAPSLEQQLDFSSRGAILTVAVPASQINTLVERLSLAEGQTTALRMLPERQGLPQAATASKSGADAWQPLMLWLTEGPKARQEIVRISQTQPDAIVLVPVVLEPARKR